VDMDEDTSSEADLSEDEDLKDAQEDLAVDSSHLPAGSAELHGNVILLSLPRLHSQKLQSLSRPTRSSNTATLPSST